MYRPAHRREPEPATSRWQAPLVVLAALTALLLPVSASLAVPGQPSGGKPGPAAGAAKPGAVEPGAEKKQKKDKEPEEPVWTGTPGTNLAHGSYGYPWPAALDCNEADVASGGCVNDGVGFFQGQCTSWVAHRLAQRNSIAFHNWFEGRHWGNASEWSRVAKALDHVSDKVPSVGAVGWYARGHVSYVEDVNSDGSIVVSEMNTDGHNGFVVHTVRPGEHGWPDRFLHLGPVTDVADTTAPTAPADLGAEASPRGDVTVSWTASADDSGVAGYRVQRNGVALAETGSTSYVDRQASPGQAYSYSVVAVDGAGNVSGAATTTLSQAVAPDRARDGRPFTPGSASVIAAGDSTAVCGLLGTPRHPRVGCRLRTLEGWALVATGRTVPWGHDGTRAFVAGRDGTVWFCRVLLGTPSADACLPLDVAAQSWGYDRVGPRRPQASEATWVTGAPVPVRCGTRGDRASCSVLLDRGWRTRDTAGSQRLGDPLSRAFVGTGRGAAFCRTVDQHATCTPLTVDPPTWLRARTSRAPLPHGRWVSSPAGPTLCLPTEACRTLPPPPKDRT